MEPKMISAKLIKSLESEGFSLEFPSYTSNENRIIEILKSNNERLLLALPLLFQYPFNYKKVIKRLKKKEKNTLNRIIGITQEIFKKEKIDSPNFTSIIKLGTFHKKILKPEFEYYYGSFKSSLKQKEIKAEKSLAKQIEIRGTLNLNRTLSQVYSLGKQRIMEKIFNHEQLTNTELKYYYRAIRPLILSILNENLQKYIRIIESTKKYSA